jgi:hypothetical protein
MLVVLMVFLDQPYRFLVYVFAFPLRPKVVWVRSKLWCVYDVIARGARLYDEPSRPAG